MCSYFGIEARFLGILRQVYPQSIIQFVDVCIQCVIRVGRVDTRVVDRCLAGRGGAVGLLGRWRFR